MRDRPREPWLRGPVPGIPTLLQPAAHAFLMVLEDTEAAIAGLTRDQLGRKPEGAASIAFHLTHLAGSTDRLLTYARGEALSETQHVALAAEQDPPASESAAHLFARVRMTMEAALRQLAVTPESARGEIRFVGRARHPSSVLGLLFHAAEHAQRHTGQIITTAKIVRGSGEAR